MKTVLSSLPNSTPPAPLIKPLVALVLGIGLREILPSPDFAPLLQLCILSALVTLAIACYARDQLHLSAGCLLSCFLLLGYMGKAHTLTRCVPELDFSTRQAKEIFMVETLPRISSSGKHYFEARALSQESRRVLYYASEGSIESEKFFQGSILIGRGDYYPFVPPSPARSGLKNWKAWYNKKGIHGRFIAKSDAILHVPDSKAASRFSFAPIRKKLNLRLSEELSGSQLGLATALLMGHKNLLAPSTRKDFQVAGCYHVLAVSGFHVGIIYLMVRWLIGMLVAYFSPAGKLSRSFQLLSILLVVWLYGFFTGASPSVLRACSMLSCWLIARHAGLQNSGFNGVLLSCFILLLADPSLINEPGFILSISAVLGILSWYPILRTLFSSRLKAVNWAWELCCVSIAAQIGTLAPVLFFFKSFPCYFLLANLIAIPLVTLSMYAGLFYLLVSSLSIDVLQIATAFCFEGLLEMLQMLVNRVANLPAASLTISSNNPILTMSVPLGISLAATLCIRSLLPWRMFLPAFCLITGSVDTIRLASGLNSRQKYVVVEKGEIWLYWGRTDTVFSRQRPIILPGMQNLGATIITDGGVQLDNSTKSIILDLNN